MNNIYIRGVTFQFIDRNVYWDGPPKSWRADGLWRDKTDVLDFVESELNDVKYQLAQLKQLRRTIRIMLQRDGNP